MPPGRTVVGRETEVAAVRTRLRAGRHAGVVLKGEGGRGKSTLARRYAEVHGGDYHGGLWIHAGTRQAVIDGLMALWPPELQVPDTPREQHAQTVLRKVEAGGKKWLFVYDNVEAFGDIKGLMPTGAHLIVTTRQGEGWPGWEVIQPTCSIFPGTTRRRWCCSCRRRRGGTTRRRRGRWPGTWAACRWRWWWRGR